MMSYFSRPVIAFWLVTGYIFATGVHSLSQAVVPRPAYGPYNAVFLSDGVGLAKEIPHSEELLKAGAPWSMSCWVRTTGPIHGQSLLAGLGDPSGTSARFFGLQDGHPMMWLGAGKSAVSASRLDLSGWHMLVSTFDGGTLRLFVDGADVFTGAATVGEAAPVLALAPTNLPWTTGTHFGGRIALFSIQRRALGLTEVKAMLTQAKELPLLSFERASPPWQVQTTGEVGMTEPQDPTTLPVSATPPTMAVPKASAPPRPRLAPSGPDQWTITGGWQLLEAPKLTASGTQISQLGFDTHGWMQATVPGTVLTTMIDRGIYPDPDYGLNNMAIPESLNKQNYWYRTDFPTPVNVSARRLTLTLEGVNYSARVWLNGKYLGETTGAFLRGNFDVTGKLRNGATNSLAILVSPPPHPGIAQEESMKAGQGPNGGIMAIDGPTFFDTEGWDWIPSVRDRDTGLWQKVTLRSMDSVSLGDALVITTLPLPDTSRANIEIRVPITSAAKNAVRGTLEASFDEVHIRKSITLEPGETTVALTPREFSSLVVQHPRLWWPNGYGKPELHKLTLTFRTANGESDTRKLRFGIRELTYEVSLLDPSGHLRRVEVSPTEAASKEERPVDVTHDGIRESAEGWVGSLTAEALASPAVHFISDHSSSPYLLIKVNGVRIAIRGGDWGMDDMLKRVSRAHLEPYFRLTRDAHLNMIRNWMGQSTEEAFYDLADKYGLLVWNDFWVSSQNWNLEPGNSALFLRNARDTILRYRNHPSIAVWCGRNEGVLPPTLNNGLGDLLATLDGTRYFAPDSAWINVQKSGPWGYLNPTLYFTSLGRGFTTEIGSPSLSTLESLRASIPPSEQWPPSDTWAYHDWHGGEGAFTKATETELGPSSNLEDFEKRAQLMNYVDYRAMFEGFNAHLWAPNTGRLLWMTQPSWPSNVWQIYSSDYDTQASYYGVMKASEPVHVQLNLPGYDLAVVNNTLQALTGLHLRVRVLSTRNDVLMDREETVNAAPNAVTGVEDPALDLKTRIAGGVVFVKLDLRDAAGKALSNNFYWEGKDPASYRALDDLLPATITAAASSIPNASGEHTVQVVLHNAGNVISLADKLTLMKVSDGTRILPAYYTDNYVSLLPGETRTIDITYPAGTTVEPEIGLRGWNIASTTIAVRH